jgi:hypothetical protein
VVAERSISLSLRRHLIARGRVASDVGEFSCIAGITVAIKRNGVRVKRAVTTSDGRFWLRIPDRGGRYRALISESVLGDGSCSAARSTAVRHAH